MQKENTGKFLKNRHIGHIGGPILFTAPHSKQLWRGGKKYNEEKRIHHRELYTTWIAIRLAQLTGNKKDRPNSFMVWGKAAKSYEGDLDPNYLLAKDF